MHSGSGIADTQHLRKARGAFFTPPELCRYMAEWAIRAPTDRVLEPSCGEAAFLPRLSGSRAWASVRQGRSLESSFTNRARALPGTFCGPRALTRM